MGDNECNLVDDGEDVTPFLGSLSFSEDKQVDSVYNDGETEIPSLLASELPKNPQPRTADIYFEITDANIIIENKSKYVIYTILVKNSVRDLSPIGIERRYSDIDRLHSKLKKSFSEVLTDVSFPRKQLTGNFKPETIAARSRSFEQYLSHLGNIHNVLVSSHFKQFFLGDANNQALEYFKNCSFAKSVPLIRKMLRLQKKIYGDLSEDTVVSLSALTVCFMHLDSCEEKAQSCSEAAIKCLCNNEDHPLLVPLLQLSIRLCWKLGKEKQDLERQLQKVGQLGRESFCIDDLKELVLSHWKSFM